MPVPSTSSAAASPGASAGPPSGAAARPVASPRRASDPRTFAALILLAALLGAPAARAQIEADVGAAVSAAYAAWAEGEAAVAIDLARAAIALDDGVPTLVARRVLVLALTALRDPAAALAELQEYVAFDLVPADRRWAEETEASLRAALPPAGEPPAESPPAAGPESPAEPAAEPSAAEPAGPGAATERAAPDGPAATPATGLLAPFDPVVILAAGGGYQYLSPWSYATPWAEVSVRLVGPLRLAGGWQGGIAPDQPCQDGTNACAAVLSTATVGPQLRAAGAIASPFVDLAFLLGFNAGLSPYSNPVVPGASAGGGVEIGERRVAFRVRAAFRLLGPVQADDVVHPGVLAGLDLAVRLGGAR